MLGHYLNEIADREFAERDLEIPRLITRTLQEMASRGITYSTITLDAIAVFFLHEFLTRCDFVKNFVVSHPALLPPDESDPIRAAKSAYQNRSFGEREKIRSLYESSTANVSRTLQNESMKEQIKHRAEQAMEERIAKNDLYVEIAYREMAMAKQDRKEVLFLRPNLQGLGVDLKELYRQHLEPLFRQRNDA